jgi:hypothetical protein
MTGALPPHDSEEFLSELSEVALGVASGRRRAEILRHVENCSVCSNELDNLALTADAVLRLAPEIDPPLGFESRVAKRIHEGLHSRRTRNSHRSLKLAVAALVAAIVGFSLGSLFATGTTVTHSISSSLASSRLESHGRAVGEVFLANGNPSWMYMSVESGNLSGVVRCEIVLAKGGVENIGQFTLYAGNGSWGVPFNLKISQVHEAQLVSTTGAVVATALFRH